ncbi:hypothetical protein [Schaalia sp. lx-100]|uniref:hypothetical protein n=1 Tax=Schaalia sp. lx-100 TaxID=2899081 RepID=UPI001E3B113B|nr:hypothetical protein [Schaalia sp. lx-100]MCD4557522.1 hypothetical protein [Schaalia sp. lx-100]
MSTENIETSVAGVPAGVPVGGGSVPGVSGKRGQRRWRVVVVALSVCAVVVAGLGVWQWVAHRSHVAAYAAVQEAYEGARGACVVASEKVEEARAQLEEAVGGDVAGSENVAAATNALREVVETHAVPTLSMLDSSASTGDLKALAARMGEQKKTCESIPTLLAGPVKELAQAITDAHKEADALREQADSANEGASSSDAAGVGGGSPAASSAPAVSRNAGNTTYTAPQGTSGGNATPAPQPAPPAPQPAANTGTGNSGGWVENISDMCWESRGDSHGNTEQVLVSCN